MAKVTLPELQKEIVDPTEVTQFLSDYSIAYERWGVERLVSDNATNEQILEIGRAHV